MKKITLAILLIIVSATLCFADIKTNVKKNIENSLRTFLLKRNPNITFDVKILQEVKQLKGFYFVEVNIKDQMGERVEYLITDGQVFVPDIIDMKTGLGVIRDLKFTYSNIKVDTGDLSLVFGNKTAKNTIVIITDFECPFCRKADAYVSDKIKTKKDVAVYVMNFPLPFHKNAMLFAKIFESGMLQGKNFMEELYSGKYDNLDNASIVEAFVNMVENKEKFKLDIESATLENRIKNQIDKVRSLKIQGTPVFIINGKKVEGFDIQALDKALSMLR